MQEASQAKSSFPIAPSISLQISKRNHHTHSLGIWSLMKNALHNLVSNTFYLILFFLSHYIHLLKFSFASPLRKLFSICAFLNFVLFPGQTWPFQNSKTLCRLFPLATSSPGKFLFKLQNPDEILLSSLTHSDRASAFTNACIQPLINTYSNISNGALTEYLDHWGITSSGGGTRSCYSLNLPSHAHSRFTSVYVFKA